MLSNEIRQAIANEYASGVKVKVIALTYGVDESSPAKIAKQFGIPQRRPNHRKVTPEMRKEIAEFYANTKKPMKVICAKLGISEYCAAKALQEIGAKKVRRASAGVDISLDMLEKRSRN
jgi:transposase-like protein